MHKTMLIVFGLFASAAACGELPSDTGAQSASALPMSS